MSNINERNEEYESSTFQVPPQFHSLLGEEITGNHITTKLSRLRKKKKEGKLTTEEQKIFNWLKGKDNTETNKIYARKDIMTKTGAPGPDGENGKNFHIRYHEKDKDNANPTKIGGLADLSVKGKRSMVSDQIENNRVQYYESYDKEIQNMKYLIEYMDNNKTKIIKS